MFCVCVREREREREREKERGGRGLDREWDRYTERLKILADICTYLLCRCLYKKMRKYSHETAVFSLASSQNTMVAQLCCSYYCFCISWGWHGLCIDFKVTNDHVE